MKRAKPRPDALSVIKGARESGFSGLGRLDSGENRRFLVHVYNWMTLGLTLTGFVAAWIGLTPSLAQAIVGDKIAFYGLTILELALVVTLASAIHKMSATLAAAVFLFYAAVNGLTFSVIFLVYATSSIASAFFVTAGTFGVISLYGYTTQRDLTTIGNLCFMGLVGLVIASLVNLFLRNSTVMWITTYAGVLVFVGLTAYDTQKIKQMNILGDEGTDEDRKEAISGALSLYLDFINLFLDILRIFGRRRD